MKPIKVLPIVFFLALATIVYALSGTVNLHSPLNDTWTNETNDTLAFWFNYTADETNLTCYLYLNDSPQNNDTVVNNTNASLNYNYSFNETGYKWNIKCYNSNSSYIESENRTFNIDYTSPSIDVINPNENETVEKNVTFNITATDNFNLTNFAWNSSCGSNLFENSSCSNSTCNYTIILNSSDVPNGYCQFNSSILDLAGNLNSTIRNVIVNNTIPLPPPPPPPPEPPSGGGGAGPPPVLPRKFILNFTNSTIITLNMKVSDKAYYYFDNENHTITVTNLTKDYVSLLIQSDPFKVTLNISQVIFVDLNSDDIYDLAITLDYIEAGKANITFTKLEIPETIETNSSENQTQEAPTGLLIASGTVNIISILVIILLFLTYLRLRKPIINGVKSKSKDLFMVMNGLTDKEKSIVDYLSDKGETKQSILCTELDISKASLSRWLRNLELKGIVKTKKFGKMKKINLSKQYK
jgi:uncharacterized membrane protein